MNSGYLLVLLILWLDARPVEARYEVRVVGHYNTRERCEERRLAHQDSRSSGSRMLWSECRAAE